MTSLKTRMQAADVPDGFTPAEWNSSFQKPLLRDDLWDKSMFNFTQQKSPKTVFAISEDVRDQIKYWKNRRNDSAHAKDNMIGHEHVESFWSFLQSNLSKLVVNGGKAYLVNQIRVHYDYTLTAIGTDCMSLTGVARLADRSAKISVEYTHAKCLRPRPIIVGNH